METHPISRHKKLKFLANKNVILNELSPLTDLKHNKSASRALSSVDGKKSPKNNFSDHKPLKIRKLKFGLETRVNRTPEPLNFITNFVTESKTQEVRLLKAEISYLKEALASVTNELGYVKQAYEGEVEKLKMEKNEYKSEFVKLMQKCFYSHDVDLKFKKKLECDLRSVEFKEKFVDFGTDEILNEINEVMSNNIFGVIDQTESSSSTARFESINSDQMKSYLRKPNEAIVLEDFLSTEEGFLTLQAGQRVQILGKANESTFIISYQDQIGKTPAKLLLQD